MAGNILLPSTEIVGPLVPVLAIAEIGNISQNWKGSATTTEYSLHQLSPFIGKMKSTMARTLLDNFTQENDTVYDPFSGSGTIALEAWASGRSIIANDLSPYAFALTHAKVFPYQSLEEALEDVKLCSWEVDCLVRLGMMDETPEWVQLFFHPKTLREIIAWVHVLLERKAYFILACLLGILHHQRPGFLSYPSSHSVPYLRLNKFPRDQHPKMYEYRSVTDRLEKKVIRAMKRLPLARTGLYRHCLQCDASVYIPSQPVDAIVTSPPYMRQLDYGRDNRLRLWFLGTQNWQAMDVDVSPSEGQFLKVMAACLKGWQDVLRKNGLCVLVLGDTMSKIHKMRLPDLIAFVATEDIGGYSVVWKYTEAIPGERRVRRGYSGSQHETILVLRNDKGV